MDIIYLHGLKVDCIIGVWQWERRFRQRVTIDLDLGFDIRAAARSDALADTLSYRDAAKRVQSFAASAEFALVETLAEEIARILLDEFSLRWCRVKINKFGAVRGAGDVGVVIERGVTVGAEISTANSAAPRESPPRESANAGNPPSPQNRPRARGFFRRIFRR